MDLQELIAEVKKYNFVWNVQCPYTKADIATIYDKCNKISGNEEINLLIDIFNNKTPEKYMWISIDGAIFRRNYWGKYALLIPLTLQPYSNRPYSKSKFICMFDYEHKDEFCIEDEKELDFLHKEIHTKFPID